MHRTGRQSCRIRNGLPSWRPGTPQGLHDFDEAVSWTLTSANTVIWMSSTQQRYHLREHAARAVLSGGTMNVPLVGFRSRWVSRAVSEPYIT